MVEQNFKSKNKMKKEEYYRRGSDALYYQMLWRLIYVERRDKLPKDDKFISYLSSWELHKCFKPMEIAMNKNPNDWIWAEHPNGYQNATWMKKHIELLMEDNYEKTANGIMYEFSVHGNGHRVNKIKVNRASASYCSIMEKLLALWEYKIFDNHDIQNLVWSRYEKEMATVIA